MRKKESVWRQNKDYVGGETCFNPIIPCITSVTAQWSKVLNKPANLNLVTNLKYIGQLCHHQESRARVSFSGSHFLETVDSGLLSINFFRCGFKCYTVGSAIVVKVKAIWNNNKNGKIYLLLLTVWAGASGRITLAIIKSDVLSHWTAKSDEP